MTGSRFSQLLLYARTLRHLRPRQITGRVFARWRRGVPEFPETAPSMDCGVLDRLRAFQVLRAECLGEAAAGYPTHATFLAVAAPLDYGAPWLDTVRPLLWQYQLHAFRHLDRMLRPDAPEPERFLDAVHDWIAFNPPACTPAWDPYPTSGRIMLWCSAESCHRFGDTEMLRSMAQQATWLRKNIEYSVDANHLLKNLVALGVYGALADSGLRDFAIAALARELPAQILQDGCHYERSPMYHALVLEDLLLLHAALETPPAFISDAAKQMTRTLEKLVHPDGEIPLFGDSALGEAMPTPPLLQLARARLGLGVGETAQQIVPLPNAGFLTLRPQGTAQQLIVTAGHPAPAYQLGHAHSDPLSFELSVDGQRILVDSSTHGYAESPLREYCRSVRAHNTVCVNGQEPLEMWKVFRVARRYRGGNVEYEPDAPALRVAYRAYQGYRHGRSFRWESGQWVIRDTITQRGAIAAESFLHFHPDCEVSEGEAGGWCVRRGDTRLMITPVEAASVALVRGETSPRQGWYCPRFGEAQPAPVLILRATGTGKLTFGFDILPAGQ